MSAAEVAALVKEGRKLLKANQLVEAIAVFERGLEFDIPSASLHENLATACFLAKDYSRAVRHFEQAVLLEPLSARVLLNLGATYNVVGEYQKAADTLRRAVAREKSSVGFYNLGIAQKRLGQPSLAVSAYKEAVRLDPDNVDAHVNLGNVLVEIGSAKQAIEHYQLALARRPDSAAAQRGLAKAEAVQEQTRHEISPFGRLVDDAEHSGAIGSQAIEPMSELERLHDRKELHELCQTIEEATGQVIETLKDRLDPSLTGLVRGTASAAQSTRALAGAYEKFQEARQQLVDLRRAMKHTLLRLRAHEELIYASPDIDGLEPD